MKNYEITNSEESEIINLIPIISNNVQITCVEDGVYILKNKELKRYLKISKQMFNLVKLIDNKSTINQIVDKYNNKNIEILNSKFVYNVLYLKLANFGLLIDNKNLKKNNKPNYLKLSITIINEAKLDFVTKYFSFLFNLKISIILISISFSIFAYWIKTSFDIYSKFNFQDCAILSFAIVFISTIFHELGHATSSRFFGANHSGIGIGFYLLFPVFYTDVTDIWILSKNKRIIINLSGIYFEILFSTSILILSFILNMEILGSIALFIFFKTFLNLNPFIRSDGYWVLSDLINKPNLMLHGLIKIKQIFKSKKDWLPIDFFLLIYGLISYSFIVFFIYYVLIKNPNSILSFPKNLKHFLVGIFSNDTEFSIAEIGKLLIPILFFYLIYGLVKNFSNKKENK